MYMITLHVVRGWTDDVSKEDNGHRNFYCCTNYTTNYTTNITTNYCNHFVL